MGNDRTEIAPFLRLLFPSMTADKTSHDWHGFLNAMTGLDISLDMDNATAFDQWRIKLADMGYPTWDHSPSKIAIIAAQGAALKAAEMKRQAELPAKLVLAAVEAPHIVAADLLPKPQAKPVK